MPVEGELWLCRKCINPDTHDNIFQYGYEVRIGWMHHTLLIHFVPFVDMEVAALPVMLCVTNLTTRCAIFSAIPSL